MKAFLKWFSILLVSLILALAATAGAVYLGWIPVPEWAVNLVASSRGLNEKQARSLNRMVNLYQVLKTAPESKFLDRAVGMATKGTNDAGWTSFAHEAWPQISSETKNRIRDQLEIEAPDFEKLDSLVTRAASSEGFTLNSADQKLLEGLDGKYGVSELIRELSSPK